MDKTRELIEAYVRLQEKKGRLVKIKFAEAIGVQPQMVQAIFRGEKRWSLDHLDATAKFFEMEPWQLVAEAYGVHLQETQRSGAQGDTRSSHAPGSAGERFRHTHR